jgi:hypothetical protein
VIRWILKRESIDRVHIWVDDPAWSAPSAPWFTCRSDMALVALIRSMAIESDAPPQIVVADALTATLLAAAGCAYIWDDAALARRVCGLIEGLGTDRAARVFLHWALIEGISDDALSALAGLLTSRFGRLETMQFYAALEAQLQRIRRTVQWN